MTFNRSIKNKTWLTAPALFATLFASAQGAPAATSPATTVTSGYNLLAVLLVVMIVVLAFVIWGMGQVLTALGRQLVDKNKNKPAALALVMLLGLSLLSQVSFAQDAAATAVKEVPNYGGLSENTYYIFLTVLGMEVFVILFLAFSIRRMYVELLPEKTERAHEKSKLSSWWAGLDKKIFTRAVPVEREADVMLDHDYDGIRELDNALPPWWKYGFYITIAVAFVYILNFHVLGLGQNPAQEYGSEMENARIAKERYEASNKDKIDENNVPMADAAGIQEGKQIFETTCSPCHLKDGGGLVGPNLTDDYWLHKGSLNDIFHTIKVGYPDKGMQSWAAQFSPKQISFLASFVKSLHGTKPATPKAPQGDLWTETTAAPAGDSANVVKKDSGMIAKPDSAVIKK